MVSTETLAPEDQAMHDKIAAAYNRLGRLLEDHDHREEAEVFYDKCREWGGHVPQSGPLEGSLSDTNTAGTVDCTSSSAIEPAGIEGRLQKMRMDRLNGRESAAYVPLEAKISPETPNAARFPLMEKVNEFLASDETVFFILGASGAGKTVFSKELEYQLWLRYESISSSIPLYINLPTIDSPETDMIASHLRTLDFAELQIRELKQHRTFVLVCDGYNGTQQTHNLYKSNRLNNAGQWKAKMVITCQSEGLEWNYQEQFLPAGSGRQSNSSLFREAVIAPFSSGQVQRYIDQYSTLHQSPWTAYEYKNALESIPVLKEVAGCPLFIPMLLEVLPRMLDPGQDFKYTEIKRVALYDQLIKYWIEQGRKRLREKTLSPQARATFENMEDDGFVRHCIAHLKKLSVAIYKKQYGQPIVNYARYSDKGGWKAKFFGWDDEKQLLLKACPLVRNGNQYRFVHQTVLEYAFSLAVFDPEDYRDKRPQPPVTVLRNTIDSADSTSSSDTEDDESIPTESEDTDTNTPLFWRSLVGDPSVVQFLVGRVQQEPLFKQKLLKYVRYSAESKTWSTAAANAMTILTRAGIQFNHADLRRIRIPGADLSNGVFESACLKGADLRDVNLQGAWLERADLSSSQMSGVEFGELPYLDLELIVHSCAYSPSGKSLSVGLENGMIVTYSTLTWETQWRLDEHTGGVMYLAYSPISGQLASSSEDYTVRLWDMDTEDCRHVLRGHDGAVNMVIFSRAEDLISASDDYTIKLWNIDSGECIHTFTGHSDRVVRIAFSPKGDTMTSCSYDKTARLWSMETRECTHVLSEHTDWLKAIAYSPQGNQVATACDDGTVLLWDAATGECSQIMDVNTTYHPDVIYSPKSDHLAYIDGETVHLRDAKTGGPIHTFTGHTSSVTSIMFSPDGNMLASSSDDSAVKLWDTESGICWQTFNCRSGWANRVLFNPKGNQILATSGDMAVYLWNIGFRPPNRPSVKNSHKYEIWSVKCSPKGGQFVTGGSDYTVRLWDFETGLCKHTMTGHENHVRGVTFSPQGDIIASASDDQTAKLWDPTTGQCLYTLTGHSADLNCVAFSPNGCQLATGSDDCTVRVWNSDTKDCVHVLKGHSKRIWKIKFSPRADRQEVASASEDNRVRLWDLASGECRMIIQGDGLSVYSMAYAPNGQQIAIGCHSGSIPLYNTETGQVVRNLRGHSDDVNDIVYGPREGVIATGGDDHSVRVSDAVTGQCRLEIEDTGYKVYSIDWMEAGEDHYLVGAGDNGEIRIWKVIYDDDDEGQHHPHYRSRYQAQVHWRKPTGELEAKNANIENVVGLSAQNMELLEQRGVDDGTGYVFSSSDNNTG
ncbi:hypothetical protein BGX31_004752 [Mortierella sp. GBA43]|nr:hypothetical protein BGX31_004752 [Mortierella sp. GBA43]